MQCIISQLSQRRQNHLLQRSHLRRKSVGLLRLERITVNFIFTDLFFVKNQHLTLKIAKEQNFTEFWAIGESIDCNICSLNRRTKRPLYNVNRVSVPFDFLREIRSDETYRLWNRSFKNWRAKVLTFHWTWEKWWSSAIFGRNTTVNQILSKYANVARMRITAHYNTFK